MKLVDIMMKNRTLILIIISLLTAGFAYPCTQYFTVTSLSLDPPKNKRSKDDLPYVKEVYPSLVNHEQLVLMMTDEQIDSSTTLCAKFLSDSTLQQKLLSFSQYTKQTSESYSKYFVEQMDPLIASSDYPLAMSQFCSQKSLLIDQVWDKKYDGIKVVDHLKNKFKAEFKKQFSESYPNLDFYVVSEQAMQKDCSDGTVNDLMKLDSISIVCGLLIIALYLWNVKLLIITILNLVCSFSISFGICYFISYKFTIATFAPSVQSAAMCALNFDYCLFLFSKLLQSVKEGKNARLSIEIMLKESGKVVFVSGCCLTLVCLFLMICPVQLVQSIGLCTGVSVMILVLVNISNTSIWIMYFPKFFIGLDYPFGKGDLCTKCDKKWKNKSFSQYDTDEKKVIEKSWLMKTIRKYVSYCSEHKWLSFMLICLVSLISIPFAPYLFKIQYSMDLTNIIPKHSKALNAINKFGDEFSPGLAQPYYIVLNKTVAGQTDTLLNDQVFHLTQQLITTMITNSSKYFSKKQMTQLILTESQLVAPSFVTTNVTVSQITMLRAVYTGAITGSQADAMKNVAKSLMFMLQLTTPNPLDLSTMAIMMTPQIPLTGKDSDTFIPWARDILDKYSPEFEKLGVSLYEYSAQSAMTDSVEVLFQSFPMIIGITFAIMFLILGFVFKSIMAPVRMLLETALVMVFYYGVAILMFQIHHVHGNSANFWAVIFISFSISIGLCSDYDVFSFSGISTQLEKTNYKNFNQSIIDGSENIGTVMVAGIIMCVACSGLLFSSLDMLLQFGVCLVMDLIYDTLIVVPVFVPCISLLFGKVGMWPGDVLKKKSVQTKEIQDQKVEYTVANQESVFQTITDAKSSNSTDQ